jgi:hypothetical protein
MSDHLGLRPIGQTEGASRIAQIAANAFPKIAISAKTLVPKSVVTPRQVRILTLYYITLLISSVACVALLVWRVEAVLLFDASQMTTSHTQSLATASQPPTPDQSASTGSPSVIIDQKFLDLEQKRRKVLISMASLSPARSSGAFYI